MPLGQAGTLEEEFRAVLRGVTDVWSVFLLWKIQP